MTDNVVAFDGITTLDIPPEKALKAALERPFESVVIIGWVEDSEDMYFASSSASNPEVLYLLEMAKRDLLDAGSEGQ